ncbi:MAG: hypothetical protein H6643_13035 [Caldilineaceae bacterium]|nr:hypothetical protein [Caldilineaceae bacterium]
MRTPLFYKILWANIAIVALGAVGGTMVTVWHVTSYPDDIHYELIAVFAGNGGISPLSTSALRKALDPLDRLQEAVDETRSGRADMRVVLGDNSDERFDRLAGTFNQMLAQLEHDARDAVTSFDLAGRRRRSAIGSPANSMTKRLSH